MLSLGDVAALALALPEAVQSAHFGTTDFHVGKKIFATLPGPDRMVLKLTPEQQEMVCGAEPDRFAPIPNKWGGRGWTEARISALDETAARAALAMAWRNVASKRLAAREPDTGPPG